MQIHLQSCGIISGPMFAISDCLPQQAKYGWKVQLHLKRRMDILLTSEFVTYKCYDWVWYHSQTNPNKSELGRRVGSAYDATQGLAYYVNLPIKKRK